MSDASRFLPPMVESTALFSDDGRYRRFLVRAWDPAKPRLCCCLLNPSVAGADKDDHTVENVVRIAVQNGAGAIEVVNPFELVSTDPKALATDPDPVGPTTDADILEAAARAQRVVAGWGCGGDLFGRGSQVLALLARRHDVECFGTTRGGSPAHPCRLSPKTRIVLHAARGDAGLHSLANDPAEVPWRLWEGLRGLDALAQAADHAPDPERYVPRLLEAEAVLAAKGLRIAWHPLGEPGAPGACVCGRLNGRRGGDRP
jgi:hypothetical protein